MNTKRASSRRVSVFTPSHDQRYLDEAYDSLSAQSLEHWEWVVLLSGRATNWRPPPDERVVVARSSGRRQGAGALKRRACELASADILVELDHDDLLASDCLAEVVTAFDEHRDAGFVYSDFARVGADGSPSGERLDEDMGWQYSTERIDGRTYERCHALHHHPHNIAYVWYAPSHVRAFRRDAYEKVGGYAADLAVLEDQDLMMRLYLETGFHHIERCLYLQRVHEANRQSKTATSAPVQQATVDNYLRGIERLSLAWARREGLATLQLRTPWWIADEGAGYEGVSVDPGDPSLPYEDGSVGVMMMADVLQRVPDRAGLFNEAYRVLAHGGIILSDTPSTDGRGAFQDPSHVAFYNQNSFMYLTQQILRPTIPQLRARLQVSHVRTHYPSAAHEELAIPYVQANLLAVKDGPRLGGPLLC